MLLASIWKIKNKPDYLFNLVLIESTCANNPSYSAIGMHVVDIFSKPSCVIFWTVGFLINDSVDNPEYILAPPPVGSTWLVPDP